MPSNVRLRYLLPALLALGMIICGVVVSAVNTRNNLRDAARVAHSRHVLLALQDTLRNALDLETGQRGFILVGDPEYLEPYHSALARMGAQLAELSRLTRDNPVQYHRTAQIAELVEALEAGHLRTIEIRRQSGLAAAVAGVSAGGGKERMDRLRTIVDRMRLNENAELDKRAAKLAASLRRTDLTVFVSGVIAIGSGVLGAMLLLLFLFSKDREAGLRLQKEKAEEADRAKSEFLAIMSHEIRTPMNAILGFGELLHDFAESPRQRHFAAAILSSGNALLSLINDILDLSKIESGKIDLVPEVVRLRDFAGNIETLFSFRAAEKGIGFSVVIDPALPFVLVFDALRLRQILVNLVGNAIKFCREGSVTTTLRPGTESPDGSLPLIVEVADTGIGIAPENLEEIFRPFHQVDSRQSRDFQGTGLGLTICRRLAAVMNGEIGVESRPGKGSIFRVTIPTRISGGQPAAASEVAPIDFNTLRPSKILIAAGDPLNRELIRNYLATSHHEILEAANAGEAAELCRASQPDIVLMDPGMPAMAGTQALEALHALGEIPPDAAFSPPLPRSRTALKSDFDPLADMPPSRRRLFAELAKILPPAASPGRDAPPTTSTAASDPPATDHADFSELLDELEILRHSVWPDLVKLVPAQGSIDFAAALGDLARDFPCEPLRLYSATLAEAAETLDFSAAGRALRNFPRLIEQLRTEP